MSQTTQILAALKRGRTLTPLDALSEFGCFRLGARIYDLRQQGYDIESHNIKSANGKHFAGYKLNRKNK